MNLAILEREWLDDKGGPRLMSKAKVIFGRTPPQITENLLDISKYRYKVKTYKIKKKAYLKMKFAKIR